jgi:dihydrofolate reductase
MNLIVAVDKNWAIGKDNKLLIQIPEDLRFFRNETTDKVILMGRKTLKSFPGGKPLKNRTNIVLTSNPDFKAEGVTVVHSIKEALEELKKYKREDIYIIGGQSIYEQFLDYCDIAHVTKIDYSYDADTYFPNLDEKPEWVITEISDERTYYDIEYMFCKYVNRKKQRMVR